MIEKMFYCLIPSKLREMCKSEKGTYLFGFAFLVLGLAVQFFLDPFVVPYNEVGIEVISQSLATNLSLMYILGFIIIFYISHYAFYLIATRLFGGKGSFVQQAYMAAITGCAITIIDSVLFFLLVPVAGLEPLYGLVYLFVITYQIFLLFLVIGSVHEMKAKRTIMTIILGGIVFAVLYIGIIVGFALMETTTQPQQVEVDKTPCEAIKPEMDRIFGEVTQITIDRENEYPGSRTCVYQSEGEITIIANYETSENLRGISSGQAEQFFQSYAFYSIASERHFGEGLGFYYAYLPNASGEPPVQNGILVKDNVMVSLSVVKTPTQFYPEASMVEAMLKVAEKAG